MCRANLYPRHLVNAMPIGFAVFLHTGRAKTEALGIEARRKDAESGVY
jgi:hypothetical protein